VLTQAEEEQKEVLLAEVEEHRQAGERDKKATGILARLAFSLLGLSLGGIVVYYAVLLVWHRPLWGVIYSALALDAVATLGPIVPWVGYSVRMQRRLRRWEEANLELQALYLKSEGWSCWDDQDLDS
jgi:hypothetical protein